MIFLSTPTLCEYGASTKTTIRPYPRRRRLRLSFGRIFMRRITAQSLLSGGTILAGLIVGLGIGCSAHRGGEAPAAKVQAPMPGAGAGASAAQGPMPMAADPLDSDPSINEEFRGMFVTTAFNEDWP